MTTKLKASRFHIRRPVPPATPPRAQPMTGDLLFDNQDDGFGAAAFPTARARVIVTPAVGAKPAATGAFPETAALADQQLPDAGVGNTHPADAGADETQPLAAAEVTAGIAPDSGALVTPPPVVPPAEPAAELAAATPLPAATDSPEDPEITAAFAAITAEGFTLRQLRNAVRLAQQHNLPATSKLDAVRRLRLAGLDPYARAGVVDLLADPAPPNARIPEVEPDLPPASQPAASQPAASQPAAAQPAAAQPAAAPAAGRALTALPGDSVKLPQKVQPIRLPTPNQRAEVNQATEIQRMQQDIARRRRRRLVLLAARMFVFVFLPTMVAGWYYYMVATPLYATKTEFVIQQAGPAGASGLGSLFSGTAMATSQDSIAVQGYLQSRDAMMRLDADLGFRAHFKNPVIDPLQRLAANATLEAAYRTYKKYVKISYDPTEGIIKMEVVAADPAASAAWANQLIKYAEEQVDHLTQRLREDQMRDALDSYQEVERNLQNSQRHLIELQEKFKVVSSETEVGLVTAQITSLDGQLTQERLSLSQMESNETPNQARMEPVKRRIVAIEAEIAGLRAKLTEGSGGAESLARVQGELLVAQADVQTRQLILAQSLQAMEVARTEANRQTRYLSISVNPTVPDEAAYPRAFENTLVAMLILLGIYLMVSMTAAILREQVSA